MDALSATLGIGDAVLWFGISAALLLVGTVALRFRENSAANLWLLILLLTSLAGMFLKFLSHNGALSDMPHLYRVNNPIGLCRPVSLYLYIWYLLNPRRSVRWRDALHFLPVVALVVYLWPVYMLSPDDKVAVMSRQLYFPRAYLPAWYLIAGVTYSFAYWALSLRAYLVSDLRAAGKRRSQPARRMHRWVVGLLIVSLLFMFLVAVTLIAGGSEKLSYLVFQYMSILIVVLCLFLLSSTRLAVSGEIAPRYEKSTLSKSEKASHAAAIKRLMEVDEIYRQNGLRLGDLAQKLDAPEYVVSQVINEEFHMSFTDLVNDYRVAAAKRMLRNNDYADYTIEGIGQEVGFRSRASFYSTFKRVCKMTPAAFRDVPAE